MKKAKDWIGESEAERISGIPREVLHIMSGLLPPAKGTSVRRRMVLKFWGECRSVDPFSGPSGYMPKSLVEDIKICDDWLNGRNRRKYNFDDPRAHPILAVHAYGAMSPVATLEGLIEQLAQDLADGPPPAGGTPRSNRRTGSRRKRGRRG